MLVIFSPIERGGVQTHFSHKPNLHYHPKYISVIIMISVSGGYERPLVQSGTSGSSNGLSQTGSLIFAAGACYENPNGLGFYKNPLAAPKLPERDDSLERHPGDLLDLSLYDNPSSPTSGSGNGRFKIVYALNNAVNPQ